MSADPYAPTAYAGPERREPRDCDAGARSWQALIGDGREPGIFEQLRELRVVVAELRSAARYVVAFTGVIAVCSVLSLVLR